MEEDSVSRLHNNLVWCQSLNDVPLTFLRAKCANERSYPLRRISCQVLVSCQSVETTNLNFYNLPLLESIQILLFHGNNNIL